MPLEETAERALDRKMDAAGWGLFFLWVGIAMAANVGWGVGLLGVGVITLGAQAVRMRMGVRVFRFSVLVGVLFLLVGIWNLFQVRVDIVPLLFIVTGLAFFVSMWRASRAPAHPGA